MFFYCKMSPIYIKIIIILCILLVGGFMQCVTHYFQALKCKLSAYNPRPRKSIVRQHGDYWVLHNYISATDVLVGNESVTLTTHASYMDLELLPNLLSRWQAPISLCLYASGSDFDNALETLDYLNGCMQLGASMRRFVSIHLVMHQEHVPASLQRYSNWRTMASKQCQKPRPPSDQQRCYWHQQHLDYPVNLLRNVARLNARTYYVLALDLQLLPTPGFAKKFLNFAWQRGPKRFDDLHSPYTTVFCLPTFAHSYEAPLPASKSQLRTVLAEYNLSSSSYGNAASHTEWLNALNSQNKLFLFKRSKKMDMCVAYVSINELEPLYDERCQRESIYMQGANLKGQLLQSLGYTFIILDGAFLVRRTSDSWTALERVEPASTSATEIRNLWRTWNNFYQHLVASVPEPHKKNWQLHRHYYFVKNILMGEQAATEQDMQLPVEA